jgi:predicted DNA-binding transcriptional regulator YafY
MSNVATRLLSLIMLLQTQRRWKAAELAQELEVSERTVLRYIGMIEEMGIPIYAERGPYGGFSLVRGYRLPPLLFTAEEATVLYMGANLMRELWGQTYHDAVTAVTAKLDNVLPDELRQEVATARQSLLMSGLTARDFRPLEPTIHLLRQCVGEHRCAELTYRGYAGEETQRKVDPYALALYGGLWYLVAYCRLRGELRTFRLDRIRAARRLDESFARPADFDARRYLANSLRYESHYQIVVDVPPEMAPRLREQFGHWMQIQERPGQPAQGRFGTATLEWAISWVLGLGPGARAVEPPELAQRVRMAAAGILAQYPHDP